MLCSAAASAILARPAGVCWAAEVTAASAPAADWAVAWSANPVSWIPESGARRVRRAKTGSSVLFQFATPPCTRPQVDSEPSKRSACRSARAVVTSPPYDWPQAIVRRASPNRAVNRSSVASWSGTASVTAHPVVAYDDPMSAYPASSNRCCTAGFEASWAGLEAPATR